MLRYGEATVLVQPEKRRLRGEDPTVALCYPKEVIERMELAFHSGASWKDEKQQTQAETKEVVQARGKVFPEGSGAGCPDRLCSLRPWRFSSPNKIKP